MRKDAKRSWASLYEKFFSAAFAKEANRLGIVYTPPEVADFILHSADAVARQEFGEGLADENVNILDPFTGTGLFVARLLQNKELIGDDALKRKFQKEVFAYETVLLAYYIAAVNIEAAYQSRLNEKHYEPFKGIALTDTFQLAEKDKTEDIFKDDPERRQRGRIRREGHSRHHRQSAIFRLAKK